MYTITIIEGRAIQMIFSKFLRKLVKLTFSDATTYFC
jgi:hypothetical protein